MTLYDPDSDEDSSDGGSMILSSGVAKRKDSGSDGFSIDSALMETYMDAHLDERAGLKASAYNPSALHVGVGTAVTLDGDSDDDGKNFGDDRNYAPLTVGHHAKMSGGGDMNEHEIGSDDEFQPAVHSNFPKHKGDITNEMSAHDGNYNAQDEVEVPTFTMPSNQKDNLGDKGGDKAQRVPQSEVKDALARVKQAKGKTDKPEPPEDKPDDKRKKVGIRKVKDLGQVQRERMSDKKAERRDDLEKKGLPVFTRKGERKAKEEAESMRQVKGMEYSLKKMEENTIPDTKFSYSDITVAGKTQKQINHDTYGLLDGKVDKLPNIEKALAEAEEIKDPSEKVKALIKKLKALITTTKTKKRKAEGVARKYIKRKKEEKAPATEPDTINVGGNVNKLNV